MAFSCKTWWLAARPRTWPAALAPVALGSALAAHEGRWQAGAAVLCVAFALLAQIAANFANDYFDHQQGADAPGRLGPLRAVASGLISPSAMLRAAGFTLILACATGSGLIFYGGWGTIVIGVASVVAAVAYTGGPYPLGYHGLGDVCVFVFFGPVAVVGTYYVQAGWPPPPAVWTVAAACGLLTANILVVNNVRDVVQDAKVGKRTLVVRYGKKFAMFQYAFSLVFAALTPAVLSWQGYGAPVLASMLTYPVGRWLLWKLGTLPEKDGPGFNRLLAHTALFLALWAVLLSVGIAYA